MHVNSSHLSRDFFELVKAIGESRSKQEEERIMAHECQTLKKQAAGKMQIKLKEFLVRAIYVEMLGLTASFAHIHAINATQSRDLLTKKTGYIACSLFLTPTSNLILLLINTIQKDLQSPNHVEVATALTCVSQLVNDEMLAGVKTGVVRCASHAKEYVRKHAAIAILRILQIEKQPDIAEYINIARALLCDSDPSVMGASLHLVHELSLRDRLSVKDLIPSLVSILKQIIDHRLSRDYDYHRSPAPWIQMSILRIFSVVGNRDPGIASHMYEVLCDVLRRGENGGNVGYAILFEAVRTISYIPQHPKPFELAVEYISRFLYSDNRNLKFAGISGLSLVAQVDASLVVPHQLKVVECLEDIDVSLQLKTLELLCIVATSENLEVIADRLLVQIEQTTSMGTKRLFAAKMVEVMERASPYLDEYMRYMEDLLGMGDDLLDAQIVSDAKTQIIEGTADEARDQGLRSELVNKYYRNIIVNERMTNARAELMFVVLGEFAPQVDRDDDVTITAIVTAIAEFILRQNNSPASYVVALDAIRKLRGLQETEESIDVKEALLLCSTRQDVELRQVAMELLQVDHTSLPRSQVIRREAVELVLLSGDLSIIDDLMADALQNGAAQYNFILPSHYDSSPIEHDLKFAPYEKPKKHVPRPREEVLPEVEAIPVAPVETELIVRGTRKWGAGGRQKAAPPPRGFDGPGETSEPRSDPTPTEVTTPTSTSYKKLETKIVKHVEEPPPIDPRQQTIASQLFGGLKEQQVKPKPKKRPPKKTESVDLLSFDD